MVGDINDSKDEGANDVETVNEWASDGVNEGASDGVDEGANDGVNEGASGPVMVWK